MCAAALALCEFFTSCLILSQRQKARCALCVFFAAAAAAAVAAQDTLLPAYPEDGNLVIWGCAARQSTRAREIDAALSDAAWKAALFNGVYAASEAIISENSSFLGFSANEKTKIVPARGDDFSSYKSALRYNADEIRVIGNSVFLRCVYPAKLDVSLKKTEAGKRPEWIKNIPQLSGDCVFVSGFAKRHSYTSDTIAAAYENANIALAAQKNASIETHTTDSTLAPKTETVTASAAHISSFFVLEIFIDGATGDVWVLAAGI